MKRHPQAWIIAALFLLAGCAPGVAPPEVEPPIATTEARIDPDRNEPGAAVTSPTRIDLGTSQPDPTATAEANPDPMPTPIGTLRIADIGIDVALFEGASASVLEHGVGRLGGSGVIGETGNVVIAGHYKAEHFRALPDLTQGQRVEIEYDDRTFTYRMIESATAKPDDLSWIEAYADGQYVSLVTNPSDNERLYVVCELVDPA